MLSAVVNRSGLLPNIYAEEERRMVKLSELDIYYEPPPPAVKVIGPEDESLIHRSVSSVRRSITNTFPSLLRIHEIIPNTRERITGHYRNIIDDPYFLLSPAAVVLAGGVGAVMAGKGKRPVKRTLFAIVYGGTAAAITHPTRALEIAKTSYYHTAAIPSILREKFRKDDETITERVINEELKENEKIDDAATEDKVSEIIDVVEEVISDLAEVEVQSAVSEVIEVTSELSEVISDVTEVAEVIVDIAEIPFETPVQEANITSESIDLSSKLTDVASKIENVIEDIVGDLNDVKSEPDVSLQKETVANIPSVLSEVVEITSEVSEVVSDVDEVAEVTSDITEVVEMQFESPLQTTNMESEAIDLSSNVVKEVTADLTEIEVIEATSDLLEIISDIAEVADVIVDIAEVVEIPTEIPVKAAEITSEVIDLSSKLTNLASEVEDVVGDIVEDFNAVKSESDVSLEAVVEKPTEPVFIQCSSETEVLIVEHASIEHILESPEAEGASPVPVKVESLEGTEVEPVDLTSPTKTEIITDEEIIDVMRAAR